MALHSRPPVASGARLLVASGVKRGGPRGVCPAAAREEQVAPGLRRARPRGSASAPCTGAQTRGQLSPVTWTQPSLAPPPTGHLRLSHPPPRWRPAPPGNVSPVRAGRWPSRPPPCTSRRCCARCVRVTPWGAQSGLPHARALPSAAPRPSAVLPPAFPWPRVFPRQSLALLFLTGA